MKFNELKQLDADALKNKANELGKELFNLKFQHHTGRLENTSKISQVRKEIAQVKTLINACKG